MCVFVFCFSQRLDTAWMRVVVYDQLLKEMKRNAVLPGFEEAPILFPPTYRYGVLTTTVV